MSQRQSVFAHKYTLLPFLALLFSFFIIGTGKAQAEVVDIRAGTLTYDEENKYVQATGTVTVTWENKVLTAGSVKYWVEGEFFLAEGNVSLQDADSMLFGDSITYDIAASTGEVSNASGLFTPWFFSAQRAIREGEDVYAFEKAGFTTCNLDKPHYVITARHIRVVRDKRILIYSPVFLVRGIPVLWLPIYYQGMGPHNDDLDVSPGYTNEDGLILKIAYGYPLGHYGYGRLYLDYFSKRGLGKGLEYTYYQPDRIKGTIFGYHIREWTTGNERWNTRAAYWQRFSPLWIGQGEFNFLSDTTFNNSYLLENWQRTNQELRSNLAVTRQSSRDNLRMTLERVDALNTNSGDFEPSQITLPRLDYTLYPQRGRLFYTNFTASFQNQYLSALDYYLLNGTANGNITRDCRLNRNMTLTPTLGLAETWQDRQSAIDSTDAFITRYYSNLNLRYRPAYWADWNWRYNYQVRSAVNSLALDTGAGDDGVETDEVSFLNSMYLTRRLTMRNSTSYDIRRTGYNYDANQTIVFTDWRQRFRPLVNEFTWLPSRYLFAYFREVSNLYPHYLQSIQFDSRLGESDERYLRLGAFYQPASRDQVDVTVGFGFWPSPRWRIDYDVRSTLYDGGSGFRANFQELKLYRDLHCWDFRLTFRKSPFIEEVYFTLDLKSVIPAGRRETPPTIQEREFYPWR